MARIAPIPDPAKPQDHGGARPVPLDAIVIHTTEGGSIEGAAAWWDRDDVIASAHYLLDEHRVVQRVDEELVAYHAGSMPMNRRSIGIEVVGHADDPRTWSVAKLQQLVALCADIVERHGIPVLHQPGPGICGHCDVPDPRNPNLRGGAHHHHDPGSYFPWEAFFAALRAELEPKPREQRYPPGPPPAKDGGAA